MKRTRVIVVVVATSFSFGAWWFLTPTARHKAPASSAGSQQTDAGVSQEVGNGPAATADSTAAELADRILTSYQSLTYLKLSVDSTYYWWHEQSDSLAIDPRHFPPPPKDAEQTSARIAREEVESTPALNKARFFKMKKRLFLWHATPFLEFEFKDGEYLEKNLKTGRTATYSDSRKIGETTDDNRFLCETAMWVPPLVGSNTHQGKRFSQFVERGEIVGDIPDGAGNPCTVVLVRSTDRYDYFWVNSDCLVTRWIIVMPLPPTDRLDRVAYVKEIRIDSSERKEVPQK